LIILVDSNKPASVLPYGSAHNSTKHHFDLHQSRHFVPSIPWKMSKGLLIPLAGNFAIIILFQGRVVSECYFPFLELLRATFNGGWTFLRI